MSNRPISYTAIACFLECKGRYKHRYIENAKEKETESRGRIVHEYIENILKDNFTPHSDPVAAFIALNLCSVIDKSVKVYHIEEEILFHCVNREFIARPDLILERVGGEIDVVDFKAFGLSEKNVVQGAVYYMAALSKYGRCDRVMFLSPTACKTYRYTKGMVETFLRGVVTAIESEKDFEYTPGAHCHYCPYKEVCSVYNAEDDVGEYIRLSEIVKKLRNRFISEMRENGCVKRNGEVFVYKNGNITKGRVAHDFIGLLANAETDE